MMTEKDIEAEILLWTQRWRELKDTINGRDTAMNAPQLHKIEGIVQGLQKAVEYIHSINTYPHIIKVGEFFNYE